jgi:hypothetical protein
MNWVAQEFGERNAKAPAELARFAFLRKRGREPENGVRNRKRVYMLF